MRECYNNHIIHEVIEPEGNRLFAFVVYPQQGCNSHIAGGFLGKDRDTHAKIHEYAQQEEFWDLMGDDTEPIGGGILYLRTGESRGSIHYGEASSDAWNAVEKFINKNFDHKVEE